MGFFDFISSFFREPPRRQVAPRPSIDPGVRPKADPNVYRPTAGVSRQKRSAIEFRAASGNIPTDLDIKDIVDALTGSPLNLNTSLFQCQRCKVFYQAPSVEVIRAENGGRCVSCLHSELISVSGRREQRGRNAEVDVVTLGSYRNFVGRVITFQGHVHKVLTSRRGSDYALMFEDASWTKGFKMVAFRGTTEVIGGEQFLRSLVGRKVSVRGLLVNHSKFGYEIIINSRAMILKIE